MRILIVENNNKLAGKLKRLAAKKHYESVLIEEGEEGVDEAQSGIYDAVIIDTELPDCSGFDVLKRIRKAKVSTPILMLSPKCGVSDKVLGLESGADDFMEKPFADDELLARLHAITRRKGELILDNRLHFSELSLDMGTYEMAAGDEYIKLSNKEFELMKYFIMNGRNIINKEDLLVRLWGFENMTAENNLEVYISYLRRKLLKLGSRIQIFCIKNVGYRLLDPQLEHVSTEN